MVEVLTRVAASTHKYKCSASDIYRVYLDCPLKKMHRYFLPKADCVAPLIAPLLLLFLDDVHILLTELPLIVNQRQTMHLALLIATVDTVC